MGRSKQWWKMTQMVVTMQVTAPRNIQGPWHPLAGRDHAIVACQNIKMHKIGAVTDISIEAEHRVSKDLLTHDCGGWHESEEAANNARDMRST